MALGLPGEGDDADGQQDGRGRSGEDQIARVVDGLGDHRIDQDHAGGNADPRRAGQQQPTGIATEPRYAGQPRNDRGDDDNARQNRERNAVVEVLPMRHVQEKVPVQCADPVDLPDLAVGEQHEWGHGADRDG
jgi:hypothetical protein